MCAHHLRRRAGPHQRFQDLPLGRIEPNAVQSTNQATIVNIYDGRYASKCPIQRGLQHILDRGSPEDRRMSERVVGRNRRSWHRGGVSRNVGYA